MSAKVSGEAIEVMIDELLSVFQRRIENALAQEGIDVVDADDWYPAEKFSSVIRIIEEEAGDPTAINLGVAIVESMEIDGTAESVVEGLNALPENIGTCHRGDVGEYDCKSVGDDAATVTFETPYPCSFNRGLIKGMAQESGAGYVSIDHASERCGEAGGQVCSYKVSW